MARRISDPPDAVEEWLTVRAAGDWRSHIGGVVHAGTSTARRPKTLAGDSCSV
jgi:hypothetical protein